MALITGGASGIGEAMARLFSRHGAKVMIADIQDSLAQSVCKDIGPANTSFIHCDVTKEADIVKTVNATISKHGKLGVMVNSAGIVDQEKPNILDND